MINFGCENNLQRWETSSQTDHRDILDCLSVWKMNQVRWKWPLLGHTWPCTILGELGIIPNQNGIQEGAPGEKVPQPIPCWALELEQGLTPSPPEECALRANKKSNGQDSEALLNNGVLKLDDDYVGIHYMIIYSTLHALKQFIIKQDFFFVGFILKQLTSEYEEKEGCVCACGGGWA